jgi:peptide/nickel transport system permease protein
VGIVGSLLLLLGAFLSIVWVPYPVEVLDVGSALQDPSTLHWLGTDNLGRDMLSILMKGMLTSFVVGGIAVLIGASLGVPLGLGAAAWQRPAALVSAWVGDVATVFPALIIGIGVTTLFGPSAVNVMVAVGIANVAVFAALTRTTVVTIKQRDYVAAARLAGLTPSEVTRRHVLPALGALVGAQAILQLAVAVSAEAGLSFVGLGAQPPATSLGLMLKDAQTYALLKPSLAIIPGLVVILMVVALNLAGNGLMDRLDPPVKRRGEFRGTA